MPATSCEIVERNRSRTGDRQPQEEGEVGDLLETEQGLQQSTSANFAEMIATTMTTTSGAAAIRVSRPMSSRRPAKNSTPETNGVNSSGKGMPQPLKLSVTWGRALSLPQPLHRKTQPTTIRATRGGSQVK